MNRELERYLKRATRGLHGAVRRDVWQELEQDVQERVRVGQAFGLSEQDALRRALEQLGDPREVSAGMAGAYRIPLVFKGLSLLGLVGLSLFAATSSAQLSLTMPSSEFAHLPNTSLTLREADFKRAMDAAGLTLTPAGTGSNAVSRVVLPNGREVQYRPFPASGNPPSKGAPTLLLSPVLSAVREAGYPVEISGWNTLSIRSSLFNVTLEPAQAGTTFANWYRFEGAQWATDGLFDRFMVSSLTNSARLEGRRPDLAGQVVVAVTVMPSTASDPLVIYRDTAQGQQPLDCKARQPRASAYAAAAQVGQDGRFVLEVLGGTLAQKTPYTLPRTLEEACVPQPIRTGVYLAAFRQTRFEPIQGHLKVGQRLEPGKTYTF